MAEIYDMTTILDQHFDRSFSRRSSTDNPGCHEWLGHRSQEGYGLLRINRVAHVAHRVAWGLGLSGLQKMLNCLSLRCAGLHE